MTTCRNCGADLPATRYCVVCGTDQTSGDHDAHRRFAAAPHEAALGLRFASTMLPRLPRSDTTAFRIAAVIGVVVVVALALLRYFSVALLAGAFIVPLLMVIYIYDVDDYEDEPLLVTVFTVAWGVLAGGVYGFVLGVLFPVSSSLFGEAGGSLTLRIVVLPLVALALMLVGPLLLLPYRKFNDVLDGATFGLTTGAVFAGAQLVVQSSDLISQGLQPGGDVLSWTLRILLHSFLIPVISGAAVGACAGAFWLRWRAPVRDRDRLGPLGQPIVAAVLAALLMIGSSAALILLRDVPRLLALAVLAGAALLWLRLVVHLGLLEEAVELTAGPPVTCTNCGKQTPSGAYCGECGVALRALPKRPGGARSTSATPDGPAGPDEPAPPASA